MSIEKPVIIFDTDMDTDCDDAGALVMLLHAAAKGDINLLGIVVDAPAKEAAPCCEAFCHHYDVETTIGSVREEEFLHQTRFESYRSIRARHRESAFYNRPLANLVGKRDTDYPDAAQTYRRLLSSAEDHSVTIVCVGFLTAYAELLLSGSDDISPLSGAELVSRKVRRLISMGELPVQGDKCESFNYAMDQVGTEIAFTRSPVPFVISAEGERVITGAHLSAALTQEHPLRMAYEAFTGARNKGRCSWDLIAVLRAMYPDSGDQHERIIGQVHACADEKRMWVDPAGTRGDMLLVSNISHAVMEDKLNTMLF